MLSELIWGLGRMNGEGEFQNILCCNMVRSKRQTNV